MGPNRSVSIHARMDILGSYWNTKTTGQMSYDRRDNPHRDFVVANQDCQYVQHGPFFTQLVDVDISCAWKWGNRCQMLKTCVVIPQLFDVDISSLRSWGNRCQMLENGFPRVPFCYVKVLRPIEMVIPELCGVPSCSVKSSE